MSGLSLQPVSHILMIINLIYLCLLCRLWMLWLPEAPETNVAFGSLKGSSRRMGLGDFAPALEAAVFYLRCLKDFENKHAGSCLGFSTPVFLFLRGIAFGVAAGRWLPFCSLASCGKVTGRFPE